MEIVLSQTIIKFNIPEFLPKPGIPNLEVCVEADVLLEVFLHIVLGRELPEHHDDHSLGLVLERLDEKIIMIMMRMPGCEDAHDYD